MRTKIWYQLSESNKLATLNGLKADTLAFSHCHSAFTVDALHFMTKYSAYC